MPVNSFTNPSNRSNRQSTAASTAVTMVLELARRLHKGARSDSPVHSLPVLRRVLATGTLRELSLPDLYRQRSTVQRKHILRMLAMEAGFAGWEQYRPALGGMKPDQLTHLDLTNGRAGYPNLWFSSRAEAEQYAGTQGGIALPVGRQGVVLQELAPIR